MKVIIEPVETGCKPPGRDEGLVDLGGRHVMSSLVEVSRGSRRAQRSEHTERHTCHFGGSRAFVPSRREAHLRSGKT